MAGKGKTINSARRAYTPKKNTTGRTARPRRPGAIRRKPSGPKRY